jgi:3',5'-cyclic AMP phosphodiesterase CpdA
MSFRLAHFSDIHLTQDPRQVSWNDLPSKRFVGWLNLRFLGRYSWLRHAARITSAMLEDFKGVEPDHVLFTGDATGLSLPAEFEAVRNLLAPLIESGRITGIPGNHDLYVRSAVRLKLYETYLGDWEQSDWPGAPPIVRLLTEDLALVCLKDSRPRPLYDSSGLVGKEQLQRLHEVLADPRLGSRRRILALHYAPRRANGTPDSRGHGLRDAEEVLAAAKQGNVDLIVHGHIHERFILPAGAGTPVSLANPGSLTYGAFDRAYHLYHVDATGVRIEIRSYDEARDAFVARPGAGLLVGARRD